jgi:quinol monooxygenase YgiN
MAIPILLSGKAKDGKISELLSLFKEILPETRSYEGCISLDMLVDEDIEGDFTLNEVWESRDHYQTYFNWRVETGVLDKIVALVEDPPSINYMQIADT